MVEKSITQLIFITIAAVGVVGGVVYLLLEPLLDARTANLAVMICAITPLAAISPAIYMLTKQMVMGFAERSQDARARREREEREAVRAEREHEAKLRALDAVAENREFQAQITASRAASIYDLQKSVGGNWEIPDSWD